MRLRAQIVIAVILVVWALKEASAVLLPLVAAIFLVALIWPLQRWQERFLPRAVATLGSFLAIVVIVGAFAAILWWCAEIVIAAWPQYVDEFRRYLAQLSSWFDQLQREVGSDGGGDDGSGRTALLRRGLVAIGRLAFAGGGAVILVLAFVILVALEAPAFRRKAQALLGDDAARRLPPMVEEAAGEFRRYIVVRTGVGLATGVLVALFCWLYGLEFAVIWGVANFLLNYIPTLGSVLGVLPPALFALVQFDEPWRALGAILGVGGVQVVMGTTVDPLVQGRYLRLSAVVVLAAVVFWGWVWGVGGAFLGVPLTIALVVACRAHPATRPLAALLVREDRMADATRW